MKEHYHTELKEKFDHLQKRTLELFEYGQKQENHLKWALTAAWHELRRISELDNIDEMKDRLSIAIKFIGNFFHK